MRPTRRTLGPSPLISCSCATAAFPSQNPVVLFHVHDLDHTARTLRAKLNEIKFGKSEMIEFLEAHFSSPWTPESVGREAVRC